jgi:hypothetical protein
MTPILIIFLGLAGVAALGWAWLIWRGRSAQTRFQEAVESFPKQAGLSELFLTAANATGKPRGLRWKSCELQGEPIFATDRNTGEIYGLSGATIGFEAVAGGDMEDVEAVSDIRYVTAVFVYRDGRWQTDGRAIFNLEPAQAAERLGETTQFIEQQSRHVGQ